MKDQHYCTQLRAALTAGKWSASHPARTPNGSPLDWPRLLHKLNKHCKGFTDLAEIASQTQGLALLLSANSKDVDHNDRKSQPSSTLALGNECILPEERIEEAESGYDTLKQLQTLNFNTLNFALAYHAYALDRPAQCLSHLAAVPEVANVSSHIPVSGTTRSTDSTLQVPSSVGDSSVSSSSASFVSAESSHISEVKDGRAWAMTEAVRSICLKGMSHEKLTPDDPRKAMNAYEAALPLLTIIEAELASAPIPNSVPSAGAATGSGKLDFTSFTTFRELWRWVERLLWRAVILAAKTQTDLWTWLTHYSACSKYWPATFRTHHRSTTNSIYLRALILSPIASSSTPRKHQTQQNQQQWTRKPPWAHIARSVVNEYRAILSVSTRFPKAGERNVKVEEFVDYCVAIWEASGAVGDRAGWVVDILWWATRLTFNSYRIFRHMTRLFYVSGDVKLAKCTLRLYVQVVEKARQTTANATGIGFAEDADTDKAWVETLVQGARMLCRLASATDDGVQGIKDAREAGELIEKARVRLDTDDKQLVAIVDLAEGIWHSVMAFLEENPRTRPDRLSKCLILLLRSVETYPTASGYHHLALALARPGTSQNLDQAVVNAGMAVELNPGEIRHWHLLGLLCARMENWKSAQGALRVGAAIGEEDDEGLADGSVEDDIGGSVGDDHIGVTVLGPDAPDANKPGKATSEWRHSLAPAAAVVDRDAISLPPASSLLAPIPDRPHSSSIESFEYSLQLRMTQVSLAEHVEGPEVAGVKWFEVFRWIPERKGHAHEHRIRPSRNQSRISLDMKTPSELMLAHDTEKGSETPTPTIHRTSESTPNDRKGSISNPVPVTVPAAEDARGSSTSEKDGKSRTTRSSSIGGDTSKGKKVQRMLKNRVHKGQVRITTNFKRLGAVRGGGANLRRTLSTPDFNFVLQHSPYQASSIHSRRRFSNLMRSYDSPPLHSPSPPPPPPPSLPSLEQQGQATAKANSRTAKENRLLSDLWLMSAATFRRQGKIEQAKGAIQEAEVRDEGNPAVWTQLGLYYEALGQIQNAIDTLHKALFISPHDVSAIVHLCRLYLSPNILSIRPGANEDGDSSIPSNNVDLAVGMLTHLTSGVGWDVPEAWYYLAKGCKLQGRKERERECLSFALELSERRGVRDMGAAIGHCL